MARGVTPVKGGKSPTKAKKQGGNSLALYQQAKTSWVAFAQRAFTNYAYRTALACILVSHALIGLYVLFGVWVSKDLEPLPDFLEGSLHAAIAFALLCAHVMNTHRAGKHCACLTGLFYHMMTGCACAGYWMGRAGQFTMCRAMDARLLASLADVGIQLPAFSGNGMLVAMYKFNSCVLLMVIMYQAPGPGLQKFFNATL
ncbi:unnamed protein product [Amoebophrya sp. A25]|nr:unnamed protein product [Amoebophrya sp. A25]|eukprot:GSA25T00004454001.1